MTSPWTTGQIEESRLASVEIREGEVEGVQYRLFMHTLDNGLTFAIDLDPRHVPRVGTKVLYEWEPDTGRAVVYYPYEWTDQGTPVCRVLTFTYGDRLLWRSPKLPTMEAIMATQPVTNSNRDNGTKEVPAWLQAYEPKEQTQIRAASQYARHFSEAGFPGHFLLLLIAKMAADLHERSKGMTAGDVVAKAGREQEEAEVAAGKFPSHALAKQAAAHQEEIDDFDKIPPASGAPATEKQVKAIYAIGRAAAHLSESQLEDHCAELYGVRPSELTKDEASAFITHLKGIGAQGTGG